MFQKPPQHLYIHWPFCSSKCHFCDFVAFEQHADFQSAYHAKLCAEIEAFTQHYDAQTAKNIKTIFLGGGTPSLYPLDFIKELFAVLNKNFFIDRDAEISIETNPADIDEERLDTWRELGINRLSLGVQSLDDNVLLNLNRRQRVSDVLRTLRIAPKYFDNISVDFILGLPGITPKKWLETIEEAVSWPIKHISIYFLTIHEKTPLYFKVQKGDVSLWQDDDLVNLYEDTIQILEKNGINQYEISNFARPGHESLHNQAYWDRKSYKGFGVGASSFDGINRHTNNNNLMLYLKNASESTFHLFGTIEKLTPEQSLLELLMLSLRQKKGIDLHNVVYLLSTDKKNLLMENLAFLIDAKLIEQYNTTITLTSRGMALENEVVLRLVSGIRF